MFKKYKEKKLKQEQEIDDLYKNYYKEKKILFELIKSIEDKNTKEVLEKMLTRLYYL